MANTHFFGPVYSESGFDVGTDTAVTWSVSSTGAVTSSSGNSSQGGSAGGAGVRQSVLKQVTAIADAAATDVLTITVPNVSGGAGGRILCSSTITQTSHVGDSTRTVEYIWSVTRLAGAVAVITISIITGGTVIATKAAGSTITSTLAATAVSGGATATNTFTFQVTNTGTPASTTAATIYAECLNYGAGGVTIS